MRTKLNTRGLPYTSRSITKHVCVPSGSMAPQAKRRKVRHETYKKWVADHDHECQTVSWLDCETKIDTETRFITKLKCRVCLMYKASIAGRRNYIDKWIQGADTVRMTNIRNHAKCDQDIHAMNLHKRAAARASGLDPTSYAPIARAPNVVSIEEQPMLRVKFDLHSLLCGNRTISLYQIPQALQARSTARGDSEFILQKC